MRIASNFDGGNIHVVSTDDPKDVKLEIRADKDSEFFQWFFFRVTGAGDLDCRLNIVNAGKASYAEGWRDYQAVASYDRKTWFRVPTEFDVKTLTIAHRPESDSIYYAYFAPYSRIAAYEKDVANRCVWKSLLVERGVIDRADVREPAPAFADELVRGQLTAIARSAGLLDGASPVSRTP